MINWRRKVSASATVWKRIELPISGEEKFIDIGEINTYVWNPDKYLDQCL